MTYTNSTAIANNIAAIRAARKEAAPLRAAKFAAAQSTVKQTITYEQVMQGLSTNPLTGEALSPKFPTQEEIIAECQSMDLSEVLFSAQRRTPTQHRGYAVEIALARFVGTTFGQQFHATQNGASQVENPTWFKQLYTDLAWSTGDITPGAILQALM